MNLRKPIQQYLATKKLRKTNQLKPISSCTDSNALLLRPMVQQIGLNPQHVFIIEKPAREMFGSPMAAYTSSYGQIIAIDSQICSMINLQYSDELRFLLGHELSHAVHKHDLKRILIYFTLPWITYLGLKIIHGAAQVCLDALAKKLGADKLPLINVARSLTHFLCKHPLMELLITKRLASSCMRRQEKQADLDSARQFNCAQAGVNFMRRIQSRQNRFAEILKLFIGTHPSEQERINYLTPLAIAQAQ
ncbi:MAG TPA: M48 family metalloprotease [Candidatus Dependentiae bacterium]|nr:M48 family metalloprotease [Candidatus Dependentiae bacterium]